MPERIQRRRSRGWELPPGAVVVTRGTEWGNPFKVAKCTEISPNKGKVTWVVESDSSAWFFETKPEASAAAVKLFKARVVDASERYRRRAKLALKGKSLACWCKVGESCHADVLLELANPPC